MNRRAFLTVSLSLGFALSVACSSSSSSTSDFAGSCGILASRCHPVKTPLGKDCHNLGHDGDDSKCGPRKAECLAECPESAGSDGGHPTESDASAVDPDAGTEGGIDGGSDSGGSPACAPYCTCMTATCAGQANYPYASEAACLSACAGFTTENRTCYAAACETAKTHADKAHWCAHAAGDECH